MRRGSHLGCGGSGAARTDPLLLVGALAPLGRRGPALCWPPQAAASLLENKTPVSPLETPRFSRLSRFSRFSSPSHCAEPVIILVKTTPDLDLLLIDMDQRGEAHLLSSQAELLRFSSALLLLPCSPPLLPPPLQHLQLLLRLLLSLPQLLLLLVLLLLVTSQSPRG